MRFQTRLREFLVRRGIEVRRNRFPRPLDVVADRVSASAPVLFDVGAHVGQTALELRRRFPAGTVHAFEPSPDSFARLQAATAGDARCELHPFALAEARGSRTLHVNASSATSSLKELTEGASEEWRDERLTTVERVEVEVRTLDEFCAERSIESIDFLKIDVQGGEYAVLEGASGMLGRRAVRFVQSEFILVGTYEGQRPLHEYLSLMDRRGYRLVDFFSPLRRDGQLLQCDLLFTPREAPGA